MKKIAMIICTIWCALTSFISPVWLTLTFLYISGKVYETDGMLDEGMAGIGGTVFLFIWIIIALVPDIFYLCKMRTYGIKFMWLGLGIMAIAALICCGMCGWDMVHFLTTPISEL
ncbi:MAG: hypothetical protein J1E64_13355 [Acetatifactor sp.]|nr:hypothetical protein [Acetatifactor sp.]